MKRILGVDFSPLAEPLDRQMITLGVLMHFLLTFPVTVFGLILPFFLIFTFQWHILLIYALWYLYDRKSPQNGGYPSKWVQRTTFLAVTLTVSLEWEFMRLLPQKAQIKVKW
ncbi:hypothetical protein NECAME_09463 [Necator americanus]|uniref:Uncharacterized protein n=1 Tax=Necator americanus TaxID=51031 RepID=W2TEE8_NECAM|nr:hypothetical protein NECAME_09463 [Necator americanus]ETN79959.1 hypothetical protein NECAME_09463 [Necator americanus]